MIHLAGPHLLVAVLAGLGVYGVLARRNAVMVLVGAELLLNSAVLLLVTSDVVAEDRLLSGQVGALFAITVAAAEIGLALAVVLMVFRTASTSDVGALTSLGQTTRHPSALHPADEPADDAADDPQGTRDRTTT